MTPITTDTFPGRPPWRGWVLAGVIAAVLCGYRLYWGLDEGYFFHDEAIWALRMDPRTRETVVHVPGISLIYPTVYEYAAMAIHHAMSANHSTVPGDEVIRAALLGNDADPQFAGAIAAARITSAIAWVAAVAAIGPLGRRLYGADTGVVAALFLATSPFGILQVHCASADPLLAPITVLMLLSAWRLAFCPSIPMALLAGATAGIGFATKYTGLALLLPVALAALTPMRRRAGLWIAAGYLAAAVLGFFLAAAAGCPRCVLHPADTFDVLARHRRLSSDAPFDGNRLAASLGWYGRPWLYQLIASLPYMLGVPVYLLAVLGIVLAVRRRTHGDLLLLTFALPYFAIVGAADATFPRYLIPLVPAVLLLAARAVIAVRRPWLRWAAIMCTVSYSAVLTATHIACLGWTQQTQVARFVATRMATQDRPGDRRVAFPVYGPYLNLTRPLSEAGLEPEARNPGKWFTPPAPYFVMPTWYATAIRRDQRDTTLLSELAALDSGMAGYRPILTIPVPWYVQRPIDQRLDPGLAVDLWQGAIGFTVYARSGD